MKQHFIKHHDYYSLLIIVSIILAFTSYCVIELILSISFWLYLLLMIIVFVGYIFISSLVKWYISATNLFSTIISEDDKNLYIKLTDEFGETLGDLIYYKAKSDSRMNRYHFGESRRRKDLTYLTKEFRLCVGEL